MEKNRWIKRHIYLVTKICFYKYFIKKKKKLQQNLSTRFILQQRGSECELFCLFTISSYSVLIFLKLALRGRLSFWLHNEF